MDNFSKRPIVQAAYDEMAEAYAARIETKPHNAYMEHPYAKYDAHRETSSYFEVELVECDWGGLGGKVRVPSMSAVVGPLLSAGFTLEQILEPIPTEEFREASPKDYEELSKCPGFMCIRATKKG